jgi:uncharacterized protein
MQPTCLADTGALLAVLDVEDRWHTLCLSTIKSLRRPLATSEAVLAELFHLIGDRPRHVAAAWQFLRSGIVTVLPIGDDDFADLAELMARYHDRPMDFADATLVRLARRESLSTVFTIDHDDFETYRIDGRRRFRIVPSR